MKYAIFERLVTMVRVVMVVRVVIIGMIWMINMVRARSSEILKWQSLSE